MLAGARLLLDAFILQNTTRVEPSAEVILVENLQNFGSVLRFNRIFLALRPSEWCGTCRSRQALSNGTLVAKIGVDTAENEPIKKLEMVGRASFFGA